MLLMLTVATGTARAQSFSQPIARDVGSNPNSAASGDFNGDGKPDLAVGLTGGTGVNIMLGKGDGSFISSIVYKTDLNPEGTAVGDFNKDGKLDVAVGNFYGGATSAGNISVLLGNGDGQFQPAVNFDAGSPVGLVAIDLNTDGNLDLITASWTTNNVSVLLGKGDGTFNAATAYPVGTVPSGVAVTDFNNDGKLDLAVPNYSNSEVIILKGNGDGTFQPAVNKTSPSGGGIGIAAGDLNMDGNQDVVMGSPNSSEVVVLLGAGDGTFGMPVNYPAAADAASQQIADFNGDGKPDVAVVQNNPGAVLVLRGNGDGTLQAAKSYPTQMTAYALVVGDFNIDGKPDLVVMNNGIGRINILLNSPSPRGAIINATATVLASGVVVASFTDFNTSQTASSFTAIIDWGDGTAHSPGTVTANGTGGFNVSGSHTYASAGTFTVGVQIADDNSNFAKAVSTATVAKVNQTITFGTLANKTFGDAPFTINATGGASGNPVTFSSMTPAICSVSGNTVSILGAATCTIRASQAGGANYNAAPNVDRSFTVNKANQTITFGALANRTFGDNDFAVSATSSSGLGVKFAASGQCTISGSTVHIKGAGSCTVTASQAGNSNYNAAPAVARTFYVATARVNVTISTLTQTYDGTAKSAIVTTDPVGLNVTLSYSQGGTPVPQPVNAGTYNVTATVSEANYQGSATGVLVINKATPVITWANPSNLVLGTALSSAQLNATANVPGAFQYSPPEGTVLSLGTHQLSASFKPTDAINFNSVTQTVQLIVTTSPLYLLLDESGPGANQAAALDSQLMRDPFAVVNAADLLNLGPDKNSRVMIFVAELQLAPGEPSAAVVINLTDGNNQSFDVAAEVVQPLPLFNFTQVVFRLPDNLAPGTCVLKVKAHGRVSNSATIRIKS
jgi:hypothetical protein